MQNVDGAPHSGRPVEVDKYTIKEMIDTNRQITTYEIVSILD